MDYKTEQFYHNNVNDVFAQYEAVKSPVAQHFPLAFRAGAKVLDIGCGSGRDLKALLDEGYDAFGIEPVEALRLKIIEHSPHLNDRVSSGVKV